ncbi:MAG: fibronectin type III domain-containing protein [Candidatus Peribacteraceae bacterium]|nr:fibronectin type III domain-containing protein [Candidatus Peribacteraceae bacterium]
MSSKKTHTYTLLCAALILIPCTVLGATITAKDSVAGLGTDVTVYEAPAGADLVVIPPFGSEFIHGIKAGEDPATLRIPGNELEEAGTYTLSVETKEGSIAEATFEVLHDTVDLSASSLQADRDELRIDAGDAATVSVILRDRFGNTIPNRPVKLISSRSSDAIRDLGKQTDARGEQQFTVTATEAGSMTLRAVDLFSGNALDAELTIAAGTLSSGRGGPYDVQRTVHSMYQPSVPTGTQMIGNIAGRALYGQLVPFDVVEGFVISAPREMQTNVDESMTITAVDRNGRIVEDYTGTVNLASTDPNAILPSFGAVTFRGSDLGKKTLVLGLRFSTPGEHILYAEDSRNPNVNGETAIRVRGSSTVEPKQTITITSPTQDSMVNSVHVTVEGMAAPFVNLIVTGGKDDAYGDTDAEGRFAIQIELNPKQLDHTLRVRDDSGQNDSGNLRIKLDVEPPNVSKFTFTPGDPEEGEDILVLVEATDNSGNVVSATLEIDGETYELQPSFGSGAFQALISFEEGKLYQPMLTVKDAAGNAKELVSAIEVRKRGLPIVQNVTAEAKPSGAIVQWDPVVLTEPVTGYRLYVGDSPTNFLYVLDTNTTVANIAGLKPGTKYFIAVTAVRGDLESDGKSEVIEVVPLGLSLTVTPGNGSLMLEWTSLSEDIPLSQFILEYGIEPEALTETRVINGNQATFTLRDLLNDITYYLKLTPVTVTGEILTETAANGEGTPTSSLGGFHPGPGDPIPDGLGSLIQTDTLPPLALHEGAPQQPATGFPALRWWILLAGILGAGMWYRNRRRSIRTTDAFLQTMHGQYTGSGSWTNAR